MAAAPVGATCTYITAHACRHSGSSPASFGLHCYQFAHTFHPLTADMVSIWSWANCPIYCCTLEGRQLGPGFASGSERISKGGRATADARLKPGATRDRDRQDAPPAPGPAETARAPQNIFPYCCWNVSPVSYIQYRYIGCARWYENK